MPSLPQTSSGEGVVSIRVNGRIYEHWTSATITRSMTAFASAFSVMVPWWQPAAGQPLLAHPGDSCVVEIDGIPVITGYIEEIGPSDDPEKVGVRLSGRSKAGDLVDCSAVVKGGQLRGLDLLGVARVLCKPFGIGASVDSGVSVGKKFDLVEIENGETVHQVLVRLARERGVLVWSKSDGGVIIGRGSRGRAARPLIKRIGADGKPMQGNNVLRSSGKFSSVGRFSEIVVRGQQKWFAGEDDPAFASAQPQGRATDAGVGRYRPKIMQAENAGDSSSMAARAQWEVARRIGASVQVTEPVAGWYQTPDEDGDLWDVGLLTRVTDDVLNLDEDMLITGVTMRVDSKGLFTDLTLEPEAAHAPAPAQSKTAGGGMYASIYKQTHGG